jgi:hypothetical protein
VNFDTYVKVDHTTSRVTGSTRLNEKIVALRREIPRLNALNTQIMRTEDKQISLTDPDARSMGPPSNSPNLGTLSQSTLLAYYDFKKRL